MVFPEWRKRNYGLGCGPAGRELAWHLLSSGSHPQHHVVVHACNPSPWEVVVGAWERHGMVTLCYMLNLRLAWSKDSVSKTKQANTKIQARHTPQNKRTATKKIIKQVTGRR